MKRSVNKSLLQFLQILGRRHEKVKIQKRKNVLALLDFANDFIHNVTIAEGV